MLGAINGTYINRVVLNGRGGGSLIVADAFLVQADATAVSAGAVLAAAAHSHSVAGHVLTGSGAVSVAAALEALQSGVLLSGGSVLVASMAELTHDDHTLRVTFKPYIVRKPLGARVESSPHGLPAVLVRRIVGSRLTLH